MTNLQGMRKRRLELDIEKDILRYLSLRKIFCWKCKTQGTFDPKTNRFRKNKNLKRGVSDILGCLPDGKFLAIEVKRPADPHQGIEAGNTTYEQKLFISDVNKLGGIAFVAEGIDEVVAHLGHYWGKGSADSEKK